MIYQNTCAVIQRKNREYIIVIYLITIYRKWNFLIGWLCVLLLIFVFLSAANFERSNLYLKLFKLVFGSVSLFANENEQMLKVYTELRHIIGSSDIIAKRIYSLSVKVQILGF